MFSVTTLCMPLSVNWIAPILEYSCMVSLASAVRTYGSRSASSVVRALSL